MGSDGAPGIHRHVKPTSLCSRFLSRKELIKGNRTGNQRCLFLSQFKESHSRIKGAIHEVPGSLQ